MTATEIQARIAELNRKLQARTGLSGFTSNIVAIKLEIERLKGLAQASS